jgi:hypothetical protein
MLQVDHIYEFLYENIFYKKFKFYYPKFGITPKNNNINVNDFIVFNTERNQHKILFIDQEPLVPSIITDYIEYVKYPSGVDIKELYHSINAGTCLYQYANFVSYEEHLEDLADPNKVYQEPHIFVTSEISEFNDQLLEKYDMVPLYYFFHGFAALDWYRGYYSLNYSKSLVKSYQYDFITYNRIINNDRSYRIYFVSQLISHGLKDQGLISFGVTNDTVSDWQDEVSDPNTKLSINARLHAEYHLTGINKLVIDHAEIHGSASANIPRTISNWWTNNDQTNVDAFWHIVTETVFYYDKLHLTEKIFKPIVSKQPFMLLAAPGNLAYLKSYGFKTFDSVIDESYDNIIDNDLRTEAVVNQLHWYCNLTPDEKTNIIQQLEPIIDYNFHHFYGEFRHIITRELLDNTKTLFKEIGYDDSHINYTNIHQVLTH